MRGACRAPARGRREEARCAGSMLRLAGYVRGAGAWVDAWLDSWTDENQSNGRAMDENPGLIDVCGSRARVPCGGASSSVDSGRRGRKRPVTAVTQGPRNHHPRSASGHREPHHPPATAHPAVDITDEVCATLERAPRLEIRISTRGRMYILDIARSATMLRLFLLALGSGIFLAVGAGFLLAVGEINSPLRASAAPRETKLQRC